MLGNEKRVPGENRRSRMEDGGSRARGKGAGTAEWVRREHFCSPFLSKQAPERPAQPDLRIRRMYTLEIGVCLGQESAFFPDFLTGEARRRQRMLDESAALLVPHGWGDFAGRGLERFEQFCFEFFGDGEIDIVADQGLEVALEC